MGRRARLSTGLIGTTMLIMSMAALAGPALADTVDCDDDDDALQQAINALEGAGGTIMFTGTCNPTHMIDVGTLTVIGVAPASIDAAGEMSYSVGVLHQQSDADTIVTLENFTITGATQTGLHVLGDAHVTVRNLNVVGNGNEGDLQAEGFGAQSVAPQPPIGGGMTIEEFASITIEQTLVADNILYGPYSVGGISFWGDDIRIVNSTISGNVGSRVGGVHFDCWQSEGEVWMSTIVDNTAEFSQVVDANAAGGAQQDWQVGGISDRCLRSEVTQNGVRDAGFAAAQVPANTDIGGTIIAGNSAEDGQPDCDTGELFTSLGHNLFGVGCDMSHQPSDIVGNDNQPEDPGLGPLTDNGGAADTHAPNATSQVIDHVPSSNSSCDEAGGVDQRDESRPSGDDCEIGAFEVQVAQASPSPTPVPSDSPMPSDGPAPSDSASPAPTPDGGVDDDSGTLPETGGGAAALGLVGLGLTAAALLPRRGG